MNFMVDIETLDVESTAIVLSAAIVYFELDEEVTFEELKERTLVVKFDVAEQKRWKRSVSKDTVNWWMQLPEEVKRQSFFPSKDDVSAVEGINGMIEYMKHFGDKSTMMWSRGGFDPMILSSLCKSAGARELANYNTWCDVRTALRCLKESVDGRAYCDVPGLSKEEIKKHDPVEDICFDVMQLLYGV